MLASLEPLTAQQVTARLDADQIDFSFDRRLVSLSGNAEVFSHLVDDPTQFALLRADTIEGDLSRGRFELLGDVSITTPQGVLEGVSAFYDTALAEFALRRAALMAPLNEAAGEIVYGFAYAAEIVGEDEIVYLVDGRFTTCDRVEPHYAFAVDRLRWDRPAQQVVLEGGGIELYGMRIPLIPRLRHSLHVGDEGGLDMVPIPAYTSREGVTLGWNFALGDPGTDLWANAGIGLRQRKGLQAWAWGFSAPGPFTARFGASLRENNYGYIDSVVSLDRFPEVGLLGDWDLRGDRRLSADLTLGHYRQHAEGVVPQVREDRALVSALLRGGEGDFHQPGTSWWWLRGSHALYGDGAHYSTIGGGLGGSASLTPWLSGSAELRHYFTDGASPFVWDDIDIKTELHARSEFRFGPVWRVRLGGRYDLERDDLRTWSAELRRLEHCLTWKLGYSDQGQFVTAGVEINGLFGNQDPPPQRSIEEGPPDYWQHRNATPAPEVGQNIQQSDYSASEAMIIQ